MAPTINLTSLGKPTTDPAGFIAQIKSVLIARYRLAAVPGRPEEYKATERTGRVAHVNDHRVSVQYGCHTARVRLMIDRRWVHVTDLQLGDETWRAKILPEADVHFGFVSPGMLAPPKDEIISIQTAEVQPKRN